MVHFGVLCISEQRWSAPSVTGSRVTYSPSHSLDRPECRLMKCCLTPMVCDSIIAGGRSSSSVADCGHFKHGSSSRSVDHYSSSMFLIIVLGDFVRELVIIWLWTWFKRLGGQLPVVLTETTQVTSSVIARIGGKAYGQNNCRPTQILSSWTCSRPKWHTGWSKKTAQS